MQCLSGRELRPRGGGQQPSGRGHPAITSANVVLFPANQHCQLNQLQFALVFIVANYTHHQQRFKSQRIQLLPSKMSHSNGGYLLDPIDLPIHESNPVRDYINRKGLVQPQQNFVKRTSRHTSGAETDTEIPTRKRVRSPPRTPPGNVSGLPRRGLTYTSGGTPTPNNGRNARFSHEDQNDAEMFGLVGRGLGRARSAAGFTHPVRDEEKKEELSDDYPRGGKREGFDDTLGSATTLSFMSSITSEQWKQIGDENVSLDADGDDEESDFGDERGGFMHQRHRLPNWGPAVSRQQQFSAGGLGGEQEGEKIGGFGGADGRHTGFGDGQTLPSDNEDYTGEYTATEADEYNQEGYTADQGQPGPASGPVYETRTEPVHPTSYSNQRQGPGPAASGLPPYPASPTISSSDEDTNNGSSLTIQDILALEYTQENMVKRLNFFRQQCTNHADWAVFGQVILEKQQAVAKEMIKARQERARTVAEFEEELAAAMRGVDERMEKTRQYMARFKAGVEMFM